MNAPIATAPALTLPDSLNLDLRALTAEETICELHASLCRAPRVKDPPALLHDLLVRQSLGANCLSDEIALPHARTAAVDGLVFAIGRSSAGISFDSSHPRVRLVFLVAVPVASVSEYLRWVAALTRTLRSPTLRQLLLKASTKEQFLSAWSLGCERVES